MRKNTFLKQFLMTVLAVIVVVGAFVGFLYLKLKVVKPKPGNLTIEVLSGYNISYANTFSVLPTGTSLGKNVTAVAQNSFNANQPPRLDIYEKNNETYTKIYSFVPEIPDSKDFYIRISNVTPIYKNNFPGSSIDGLILSLSKTGADYWGDYPVLIGYEPTSGFALNDFYNGNLSERGEIKNFLQNTTDIIISNQTEEGDSAKSILTQGVTYSYPNIVLSFYGDNNCHACEHTMIPLKFQVTSE